MIKIAKKLIKANHLTEVKLNNPIYMFFIKILNYLHRSCIILHNRSAQQNPKNYKLNYENRIDLCLFFPCFPPFFDLLISLSQLGLIILLLKSGFNLGPYSPIKLLEFSPIRRSYLDSNCRCLGGGVT